MDTRDLLKAIEADAAYTVKSMRRMLPKQLIERVLSPRHGAKTFKMFGRRYVFGADVRGLLSGGFGPLG